MDKIADTGDSGDPTALGQSTQTQVLAWDDGRAIISPPMTGDFATIVNQGRSASITAAGRASGFDRGWRRARDAAGTGILRSGVAQLGSQPLSKFHGMTFPAGTRIRFADPTFGPKAFSGKGSIAKRLSAPGDTRFLTLFDPKGEKFYSLTQSIIESVEKGTPRPAIAQAVRTIGSWGGACLGAKVGCRVGAVVSVETGPGIVLGCLAGGSSEV